MGRTKMPFEITAQLYHQLYQERFPLFVGRSDTVKTIKARIRNIMGIHVPDQIFLEMSDQVLRDDDRALSDYNIQKESILNIVVVSETMFMNMRDPPPPPPLDGPGPGDTSEDSIER